MSVLDIAKFYTDAFFKDCSDLITYKIKHGRDFIYVIYLETLSSAEHINNFILNCF